MTFSFPKNTLVIFFIFFASPVFVKAFADELKNGCHKCHSDVYNLSSIYYHDPFLKKDCDSCHIVGSTPTIPSLPEEKKEEWKKLAIGRYLKEHLILLPDIDMDTTYKFRIKGRDEKGNRFSVPIEKFIPAGITEWRNGRKGPRISEVKIAEIKKGIFYEATIFWRTDLPATSQVEFGRAENFDQESSLDTAMVKNHRVKLSELEEEIYQFRVKSEDIFLNSTLSSDYILKVSELSPQSEIIQKNKPSSLAITGKPELFRIEPSQIAILWETNTDSSSEVEWQEVKKKETAELKSTPERKRAHGSGLRSAKVVGINVCYNCHPPKVLGLSHPVGVYAQGKTKIPEDLPTAEGGMVTCATCHNPHGSNQEYLARKSVDKDLCKSCHGENY